MAEGERLLTICNACRYCEGYCAVFPAMERQTKFTPADVRYLANLCHNCAECYYACQYAPPHEFAVNLPKTLAEIRLESYERYAWPVALGGLFRRNGAFAAMVLVAATVLSVIFAVKNTANADFYTVFSHNAMVAAFGGVSLFIFAALAMGLRRFWRESGKSPKFSAFGESLDDVLRLRYLSSGGAGCTYPGEHHSQARRWFHHFTFYGFALCFAATTVAAFYHYAMSWIAPYGYFSLPVILGTAGGLGLIVGPAGLLWLKFRRDSATSDMQQTGMDVSFLVLLFTTSFTGLLLLVLRETSAMPVLLAVHLAAVMALFLTMPYGKFVHGIYRWAALFRNSLDRHQ